MPVKNMTSALAFVRNQIQEPTASFWSDSELISYINQAKDDLYNEICLVNEDFFMKTAVLAPEPEAPESVKHLLLQGQWDPMPSRDVYNQRIIDAYNQGKKSSVPKKCTHPFAARFKIDDHVGCEYSEVCGTCMKVFK